MLNLNSLMIGTANLEQMGEFYTKILGDPNPEMSDDSGKGWQVEDFFFGIGRHSEVSGENKEPARVIFNFETKEIQEEYERIKATGAKVVKELYEMDGMKGMWIATFADPDGNYFQLMSPWEG
jgi:predicted enzyme related to lactoylglutathione lyase